jgi:hypothetical protein
MASDARLKVGAQLHPQHCTIDELRATCLAHAQA